MPQLVRISHHVDCCDLSIFDFERRRLKFAIGFQRDETGQSVDESCTNKFRFEEKRPQMLVQLHNRIEPQDWLRGSWTLTPAVCMNAYIRSQHRAKSLYIAATRSSEEGLGKRKTALFFYLETRPRIPNVLTCAGSELTAGRRIAPDGHRDLLESDAKHIVQQKDCPLERRKAFQRKHQRQGNVFHLFLFHNGIGKPLTNIGLALASRRFDLIEAETRDRAAQECLGFSDITAVGVHPADESVLHNILGVVHGAEHSVGDARELRTQRLETHRCILESRVHHQAATALLAAFMAAGSAQPPKPTAMRFHPLMILINNVSLTCSSSVK